MKTSNSKEQYSNGRLQWIHTRCGHPQKKTHWSQCVQTPPNTALGAILGQTGTLIPGKDETTIQIKFITGKIIWQREHAAYITARESNYLWRITDLRPDANNNIMAIVTRAKRNKSQTDNRIIPIKMVKTLITRHFEQRIANTHNPSVDFPNISEHHSPPRRNIHKYFIPEDRSFPGELTTPMN